MKRLGSLRYNVFPECVADDPAVPEVGVAPVAKVGVASAAPPPPPEPSRQPSSASSSTPAPASLPHHGSRGDHQPYVPRRPLRHAKLVADKAIKKKAIQQQRPEEGQENEEEGVIQGIAAALASALPQLAPRRRCRDSVDTLQPQDLWARL